MREILFRGKRVDNGEWVADIISDSLMEITDEDDCSVAVICGRDKELLTEWLGKECEE